MYRGVRSILLLGFLGALQGVSLCHCRAEHLVAAAPASHVCGHDNADADAGSDGRTTCGPVCTGTGSCPPRFCDQHVQAKRSNDPARIAVAGVTSAVIVAWAEPLTLDSSRHAPGPLAGDSGLLSRTTPLLI